MLDSILVSGSVTLTSLLICTAVSLGLGVLLSAVYMFRNSYTKSFIMTLVLMPAIVQLIIMLVNGNLGTGVAVAGAFSLVRFRSVPGTARDICSLFMAMMLGLATGMGYVGIALLAGVGLSLVQLLLTVCPLGDDRVMEKQLKVTIPENLDYSGIFDDIFDTYTNSHRLEKVKTTNMGSLFELDYRIALKDVNQEKAMLDDLRCRNGNLTISCGRVPTGKESL